MRKAIRIAIAGVENTSLTQCNLVYVALCDDGSMWELAYSRGLAWQPLPGIPQMDGSDCFGRACGRCSRCKGETS